MPKEQKIENLYFPHTQYHSPNTKEIIETNPFDNSLNNTKDVARSLAIKELLNHSISIASSVSKPIFKSFGITPKPRFTNFIQRGGAIAKTGIAAGINMLLQRKEIIDDYSNNVASEEGVFSPEQLEERIPEQLKKSKFAWKSLTGSKRSALGRQNGPLGWYKIIAEENDLNRVAIDRFTELNYRKLPDGNYEDRLRNRDIATQNTLKQYASMTDEALSEINMDKSYLTLAELQTRGLRRELTPGDMKNLDQAFTSLEAKQNAAAKRIQHTKTKVLKQFITNGGKNPTDSLLDNVFQEMGTGNYELGYAKLSTLRDIRNKNSNNINSEEEQQKLGLLEKDVLAQQIRKQKESQEYRQLKLNEIKKIGEELRQQDELGLHRVESNLDTNNADKLSVAEAKALLNGQEWTKENHIALEEARKNARKFGQLEYFYLRRNATPPSSAEESDQQIREKLSQGEFKLLTGKERWKKEKKEQEANQSGHPPIKGWHPLYPKSITAITQEARDKIEARKIKKLEKDFRTNYNYRPSNRLQLNNRDKRKMELRERKEKLRKRQEEQNKRENLYLREFGTYPLSDLPFIKSTVDTLFPEETHLSSSEKACNSLPTSLLDSENKYPVVPEPLVTIPEGAAGETVNLSAPAGGGFGPRQLSPMPESMIQPFRELMSQTKFGEGKAQEQGADRAGKDEINPMFNHSMYPDSQTGTSREISDRTLLSEPLPDPAACGYPLPADASDRRPGKQKAGRRKKRARRNKSRRKALREIPGRLLTGKKGSAIAGLLPQMLNPDRGKSGVPENLYEKLIPHDDESYGETVNLPWKNDGNPSRRAPRILRGHREEGNYVISTEWLSSILNPDRGKPIEPGVHDGIVKLPYQQRNDGQIEYTLLAPAGGVGQSSDLLWREPKPDLTELLNRNPVLPGANAAELIPSVPDGTGQGLGNIQSQLEAIRELLANGLPQRQGKLPRKTEQTVHRCKDSALHQPTILNNQKDHSPWQTASPSSSEPKPTRPSASFSPNPATRAPKSPKRAASTARSSNRAPSPKPKSASSKR